MRHDSTTSKDGYILEMEDLDENGMEATDLILERGQSLF
jgi:hypothetical protein